MIARVVRALALTALLAAAAAWGPPVALIQPAAPGPAAVLELSLTSSSAGLAQLFYDSGHGFNEAESATVPVQAGHPDRLVFPLPGKTLLALRLDPLNRPGRYRIDSVAISVPDERSRPCALVPLAGVARLERQGDSWLADSEPDNPDPMLGVECGGSLSFSQPDPFLDEMLISLGYAAALAALVLAGLGGDRPAIWCAWGGMIALAGHLRPIITWWLG